MLVAALRSIFLLSKILLLTAFGGFLVYSLGGGGAASMLLSTSEAAGRKGYGTCVKISTDEGKEEGVV